MQKSAIRRVHNAVTSLLLCLLFVVLFGNAATAATTSTPTTTTTTLTPTTLAHASTTSVNTDGGISTPALLATIGLVLLMLIVFLYQGPGSKAQR